MPKKSRSGKIVDFDEGKLWFQKDGNTLVLGITLDALDELGTIKSISLPADGDDFDKDDVVVEIEGEDGQVNVVTPAAGFVTEVNSALEQDTAVLAEDPIDEGWLVKLEMQDVSDLKEYT